MDIAPSNYHYISYFHKSRILLCSVNALSIDFSGKICINNVLFYLCFLQLIYSYFDYKEPICFISHISCTLDSRGFLGFEDVDNI